MRGGIYDWLNIFILIIDNENQYHFKGGSNLDTIMSNEFIIEDENAKENLAGTVTNLAEADTNTEYIIKDIKTNDEELKKFLFTLGCYEGESVTLISVLADNYVINIKDARYSIDKDLAEAIIV